MIAPNNHSQANKQGVKTVFYVLARSETRAVFFFPSKPLDVFVFSQGGENFTSSQCALPSSVPHVGHEIFYSVWCIQSKQTVLTKRFFFFF